MKALDLSDFVDHLTGRPGSIDGEIDPMVVLAAATLWSEHQSTEHLADTCRRGLQIPAGGDHPMTTRRTPCPIPR